MIYSNKEKTRGHFFVLNIPLSFFIPLNIDIVTSRIVIAMSNFFSFTLAYLFSVVVTSAGIGSSAGSTVCTWAFFFALNLSINSTTIDEATIISATSPATLNAFKNLLIWFCCLVDNYALFSLCFVFIFYYMIDYYIYKALKECEMEEKKVAILCENRIIFSTFAEYQGVF